ncbi:MAG TPA: hypothetical protein VEV81_12680, partial [Pyrinomonadaceae bacterium]|nr:hypothetical protein [Pyrinomonadaceae bacterium]
SDVRSFTQILTEMIRRHDERLDEHEEIFREANRSIAALADTQIQHEDMFREANRSIAALADAQIQNEEILREMKRSIAALADAQIRTEDSLRKAIERLDGREN